MGKPCGRDLTGGFSKMLGSGLRSSDQCRYADDGDGAPEIVGKCSQAELAAYVAKALHQEGALVHPLFDWTCFGKVESSLL